ncbi:MAG: UEV domain-containing protein, partial [Olpidium bornovanus]
VLLCLYGTLPVTFRSLTYNIPISIWLPTAYPHAAPIIYVEPTKDMLVKPSAHVDTSRRVNHPYLSYWPTRAEQSSIVEIAAILQSVFGQAPPLYTKPDARRTSPSPGVGEAGGGGPSAQHGLMQHLLGQGPPPSYRGVASEFAPAAMPSPNMGGAHRMPPARPYPDFAAGSTPASTMPVPSPATASASGPSLPYYAPPPPPTSIAGSSGAPPASAGLLAMPVPTAGVLAAPGYPNPPPGAAGASTFRTPISSEATLLGTARSTIAAPTRQQLLANALRERLSAKIAQFNMKINADMEALLVANKGLNEAEAAIEKNRSLLLDFE